MDVEGELRYKIEPMREGVFQLWTLKDMQITNEDTLVILFGFYGATQKALAKYCDIYLKRGFQVLCIPSRIMPVAWPSHAIKLSKDLLDYLGHEASRFSYFIVHTVSMGIYNFFVCNYGVMSKQPEKYGHIKNKIKAVVYDSIAIGSRETMLHGFGMTMTRNKILQALITKLMSMYFFFVQNNAEQWIEMSRTTPIEVPTLYFFCENDPISDYEYIQEIIEGFNKLGTFPVLEKCWKKSRHSGHLMSHTDEYLEFVNRLLELVPELSRQNQNIVKSKM